MNNETVLLVKIKEDLDGEALYERARGCWIGSLEKVKKDVQYVFCIVKNIIKEDFVIISVSWVLFEFLVVEKAVVVILLTQFSQKSKRDAEA